MKKIKYLLPIFLMFILTCNINAATTCGGYKAIKLNEKSASSFGFNVKMPICRWDKTKKTSDHTTTGKTLTDSIAGFNDMVDDLSEVDYATVLGTNEKALMDKAFSRCDLGEATAKAKVSCQFTATKTQYINCSNYTDESSCNNISGCSWGKDPDDEESDETCSGEGYQDLSDTHELNDSKSFKTNAKIKANAFAAIVNMVLKLRMRLARERRLAEADGYDTTSIECNYSHTVKCPMYKCTRIYQTINACTGRYEIDKTKETVYCVNPSYAFSGKQGGSANYHIDPKFDVNDCVNSYSNTDCGYANILIEGAYNKVCDNAINLALRLWGQYNGAAGFKQTGIYRKTGINCSSNADFVTDSKGNIVKVYQRTLNKMANMRLEGIARGKTDIDDYLNINVSSNYFNNIACSNSLGLGVTCTFSNNKTTCGDGNSTYQTAFRLFYNTVIGNKKMKEHLNSVNGNIKDTRPTDAKTISDEKETYVKLEFEEITQSTEKGVEVDCTKLKKGTPNYDEIYPFCQTKVQILDEKGNPITDKLSMEKCIKGDGCVTKTQSFAICDLVKRGITPTRIVVEYQKSQSSNSIVRYVSCAGDKTQTMFGYATKKPTDGTSLQKTETGETTYKINFYCSNDKGCTDYDPRVERENSSDSNVCTDTKAQVTEIKDPSLKCIVNMPAANEKDYYDYTNYFGVNSSICRVYCSDEIEFKLPGKKSGISGLSFSYNIEFNNLKKSEDKKNLSSLVTMKRTCMTEIYYSNPFPETTIKAFRKQYDLPEKDYKDISNFTKLYGAVASRYGRTENLLQLLYDLYNCNFYSKKQLDDIKLPIQKEKVMVMQDKTKVYTAYDAMKYLYDKKNNYGFGNKCNPEYGEDECIEYTGITYDGGTEVYNKVSSSGKNVLVGSVNQNRNNPKEEAIDMKSEYRFAINDKVKYCQGASCVTYNKNNEYSMNNFKKMEDMGKNAYAKYSIGGKSYKVPNNDYAVFSVETEVGFYNDSLFEIHPMSGYVSKVLDKSKISKSKYQITDNYTYPLSKDAFNLCSGHSCKVVQQFGKINTYYRKADVDRFTSAIESTNKTFRCSVSPKKPEVIDDPNPPKPGENVSMYRNVDLEKLFPSGRVPKNWTSQDLIKQIESSADRIKGTDDYYLEYSVTITPEQMRNMKDYNIRDNYFSITTDDDCTKTGNGYVNCKSSLLREFMQTTQYGTFDQNYKGESKYTAKIKAENGRYSGSGVKIPTKN